jgi:hypothetical protein
MMRAGSAARRQHALDVESGVLEGGQFGTQPRLVHHRDPGRLPRRRVGGQGEVQRFVVLEQLLLEQSTQRGTQPGGWSLRQFQALPADVAVGEYDDHTVGPGQQPQLRLALRGH